ncbi:MAG: hypothetical protein AAGA99_03175 [Actinomycetota bacterium]
MLGWIKDKASDVAGAAWDAATEVADAAVDTVGALASGTAEAVAVVGNAADSMSGGALSGVLDLTDDYVFDPIERVTGGVVDLDWENGNFSAGVHLGPIANVSAGIGEDGIHHTAGALDQNMALAIDQDGLSASGAAGVDWGPLPYAAGAVQVGADGDLVVDVEARGTFPTPYGLVSGSAEVDVVRTDEHFGVSVDADGTLRRPDGSVIRGGVDVTYLEDDDGSALVVGLEGSYTQPGLGTIGGSIGYQRLDDGETVIEGFQAEADIDVLGAGLDAGVEMVAVTTDQGTIREWDADAGFSSGASATDLPSAEPGSIDPLTGELAPEDPSATAELAPIPNADPLATTDPPPTANAAPLATTDPPPIPNADPTVVDPLAGIAAVEVPEIPAVDAIAGPAPTEAGVTALVSASDPPEAATPPPPPPAVDEPSSLDTALADADASEASVDDMFTGLA